ncbi:MAG: hypothetical protein IJZ19_12485 [Lentisphaeria bacterium]|nr:hypothetical protein [Lentisphaeria bacterium]
MGIRLFFFITLCFPFLGISADETCSIDKHGAISLGGKRFQMVFFNAKWHSFPQYTPIPGLYRIEKRNHETAEISLNFPEAKNGRLIHNLKSTAPKRWSLRTRVEFTGPFGLRSGVMSLTLPAAASKGSKLKINGKEFSLPIEPPADKKAVIFSRQCRELRLPDTNGEWVLRGNYHLLVQDNRCFRNGKTFELRFSLPPVTPPERYPAELKLDIEYIAPQWQTLDLRPAMNIGLADETANDGRGGWPDQGNSNDLRMLWDNPAKHPREFKLTDPKLNNGKACIMLKGKMRPNFPDAVSVKLNGVKKARFLYLLHALAWRGTASVLGTVVLTYADGSTQQIPIAAGRDTDNWWQPSLLENGAVAWIGENASSFVGFYRSMFPIQADKSLTAIRFESAGNAVWGILAATVGNFEIPRNPILPSYILAGKEWKKLEFHKDPLPGSVLDFSGLLDAPAGKYGPVVIRNGRFEFRDRPGVQARFYGTNICSQAVYPDRKWAEKLADRIAKLGFNAVRFHHHDNFMIKRSKSTELDPAAMDRMDYFMACLKKRGIYVQSDLFVSRRTAADEIPGIKRRIVNFDEYKALFYLQDNVFENWKQYTANYLNHKNPYTGAVVKDDPLIISFCLINEGNIDKKWSATPYSQECYRKSFQEFLDKRGISKPDNATRNRLFEEFLTQTYLRRYRQMREFVRSLGCSKPLSDQNMGCSPHLAAMRQEYDFVDNHLYFNHPEFASSQWGLPSFTRNHSVLKEAAGVPALLFQSRIFGKPFIVTEFDFARPNPHRADGALLFGVYASLQQWDGLFQFAYTHGNEKARLANRTDGYFDLVTDPVKLLSQYLGPAFFLPGELTDGNSRRYGIPLPSKPESFEKYYPAEYSKIGLCAKIGGIPAGTTLPDTPLLSTDRKELKNILNQLAPKNEFNTANNKVRLDPAKEMFQAVTSRAEAFILPAGREAQGKFCRIRNRVGAATFGILAQDGQTLKNSRRILLLHLTDSAATKLRYADQEHRKLEAWGTLPFLAARGEAELQLLAPNGKERCYAVNTAGNRLSEIPVRNGVIKLQVFQRNNSVFCYELVR